jgi:GxxExxY protein
VEIEYLHADLSRTIIGSAIEVHRQLGPGLLESVYGACLQDELAQRGIPYAREVPIQIRYKGRVLQTGYRADLIVDDKVLLELKAVEEVQPIHEAQLLTYLRLSRLRVGLLINFNVRVLKDGIRRRVH